MSVAERVLAQAKRHATRGATEPLIALLEARVAGGALHDHLGELLALAIEHDRPETACALRRAGPSGVALARCA